MYADNSTTRAWPGARLPRVDAHWPRGPRSGWTFGWRGRRRKSLPAVIGSAVRERGPITIRPATVADQTGLLQLAELSERRVPAAPVIVAESAGEVVAAVSVATAEEVSDPLRVTFDVVALLRYRVEQLRVAA